MLQGRTGNEFPLHRTLILVIKKEKKKKKRKKPLCGSWFSINDAATKELDSGPLRCRVKSFMLPSQLLLATVHGSYVGK